MHRELIITGPDASITAEMEAIAAPGEVVVMSQQTAARLDEGERGRSTGRNATLGLATPGVRACAPLAQALLSKLTSPRCCPRTPANASTVLTRQNTARQPWPSSSSQGVDDLSTGSSVGGFHRLEAIVNAVEAAAERFRVNFHETDIGPDGREVECSSADFPVQRGKRRRAPHPNGPRGLARRASGSPLRLRAGIRAGRVLVFSHQFERAGRRVIAVTGDGENVAARLMGSAKPGQLLATVRGAKLGRAHLDVTPLAPIAVKGRSEPVRATAIVTGPIATVPNRASDDSPFVGRETELQVILESARSAVRAKEGRRSSTLWVPAGIGGVKDSSR